MPRTVFLSVILAGVVIAAIAQPAMAFTELRVTGAVGAHSVKDTEAIPAAICLFKYSSHNNAYKLKHIAVFPPLMKAVKGMGTEDVAWQFTVERRIVGLGGAGPWQSRYTSARFRSSTNSRHNADFGSHTGVKVVVPFEAGADASAAYRVVIKMFWFKPDGTTVLGTVTGKVDWYYPDQGKGVPIFHGFCPDYD